MKRRERGLEHTPIASTNSLPTDGVAAARMFDPRLKEQIVGVLARTT